MTSQWYPQAGQAGSGAQRAGSSSQRTFNSTRAPPARLPFEPLLVTNLPQSTDNRWDLRRQQAMSLPTRYKEEHSQQQAEIFYDTQPHPIQTAHPVARRPAQYYQHTDPLDVQPPAPCQPPSSYSALDRLKKFAYKRPPPAAVESSDVSSDVAHRHQQDGASEQASSETDSDPQPQTHVHSHLPPSSFGTQDTGAVQLVSVSSLPTQYRSMFHFPVFNAVQSTCFEAVANSDDNVVISAPTGSGKTVLFELAIIRMLQHSSTAKAVYMAPTKSLCTQKANEWKDKMQGLGCHVAELTGDSDVTGMSAAKAARVIVTTPEKWDALTRHWSLNRKLLNSLDLMLIDEVHTLREKARGPRFEIVVSRMHAFGNNVRLIAVSATVPNVVDIAEWLGKRKALGKSGEVPFEQLGPATSARARVFDFGEQFRPCPLTKIVYGYSGPSDHWKFQTTLNGSLLQVVAEHAADKPTLVFVPTRKATTQAAQVLQKGYQELLDANGPTARLPWTVPTDSAFDRYHDAKLRELSSVGIAFHHAGLDLDDRRLVEERFLSGKVRVLCCTSTLAVGVNLPSYCVVVRGTKRYEGQWCEISDLDLLQMLGRAGRPGFDTSGVAVIMTEQSKKADYESMVAGRTTIESKLHLELVEHINSEINLRPGCTVGDLEKWLNNTFLAVRLRKNPSFYDTPEEMYNDGVSAEERMRKIFTRALQQLCEHGLISRGSEGVLECTEYGKTMSTYMLSLRTMLDLIKIDRASMKDLIGVLSSAAEFSDIRMRGGEKDAFAKLRSDSAILFPPEKVQGVREKISLLLQSVLAGLPLRGLLQSDDGPIHPLGDTITIFKHCTRIIKAMTDVALHRRDAVSAKNAFELLRSVNGRSWDGSTTTLSQLEGIGEKSVKVLANAGIYSYQQVATADPMQLQMLLKKNAPFGFKLVEEAASFPQVAIEVARSPQHHRRDDPAQVAIKVKVALLPPSSARRVKTVTKSKRGHRLHLALLTLTSDGETLFDFRRLPVSYLIEHKSSSFTLTCDMTRSSQRVVVLGGIDEIAGSAVRAELDPHLDAGAFSIHEQMKGRSERNHAIGQDDGPATDALGLEEEWNQLNHCAGLFDGGDGLDSMPATQGSRQNSNALRPAALTQKRRRGESLDTEGAGATVHSVKKACGVAVAEDTPRRESAALHPPTRLPNGNFRCNHACKDRTKCRHLCCREGLAKPPKPSTAPGKAKQQADSKKVEVDDNCDTEDDRPLAGAPNDRTANLHECLDNGEYSDDGEHGGSSSSAHAYIVDAECFEATQRGPSTHRGRLTGKRRQAENNALLERMESLAERARHAEASDSDDAPLASRLKLRPPGPLRLTLPSKTPHADEPRSRVDASSKDKATGAPRSDKDTNTPRNDKYTASFEVSELPVRTAESSSSGLRSSSPMPDTLVSRATHEKTLQPRPQDDDDDLMAGLDLQSLIRDEDFDDFALWD